MTLENAIKEALRVIYQHDKSEGELESVYLENDGELESVRGYLGNFEDRLDFDLKMGLNRLNIRSLLILNMERIRQVRLRLITTQVMNGGCLSALVV